MVFKLKLEILILKRRKILKQFLQMNRFNSFRPTRQTLNSYFCSLISIYKDFSFLCKSTEDSTCKKFRREESPVLWRETINKLTVFVLLTILYLHYLLYYTYFSVLVARSSFSLLCYMKGYTVFDLQTFVCIPLACFIIT